MDRSGQPLQIVQITDPHLRKEPDGTLLGMNTRESLDAVMDLVRENHPNPDVVLATGDIAQDGSVEAYRQFEQRMAFFKCPVYWFAGNHDSWPEMNQIIAGTQAAEREFHDRGWNLIFLDSAVPGKVHGFLQPKELDLLDRSLRAHPDEHALVCFHHHPIDIRCNWLNPIGLRNADAFFSVLDRYQQVKGVLWGHIHQELDEEREGVRMLATPSTCIQFEPRSKDFSVGRQAPGYRWLELYPDGRIDTGVIRADHIDFNVDYGSRGY